LDVADVLRSREVEVVPAQLERGDLVGQPPGVRLEQGPLLAGGRVAAARAGQVGPSTSSQAPDRSGASGQRDGVDRARI
jgi:hypothetical protein